MKVVEIVVRHPEPAHLKRGTDIKVDVKSGLSYVAGFHLESGSNRKPVHFGPIVEVSIIDDDGNVVHTERRTIAVQDKGGGKFEIVLRGMTPVLSSLEQDQTKGGK